MVALDQGPEEIGPCRRGWAWPVRVTLASLVAVVVLVTADMVTQRGRLFTSPGAEATGSAMDSAAGPYSEQLAPPLPWLVEVQDMPPEGQDRRPEPPLDARDREPEPWLDRDREPRP